MQGEPSGVIVIDKPADMTSARVVEFIKRSLKAKKVGHAGTLDPYATGVLVCCINQATRLARFLLGGDKVYRAVCHLGVETDTQDATGTVIAVAENPRFSVEVLRSVVKQFKGVSLQQPPVFSALKHKGIPLYKLAREGKPIQKEPREIFISSIDLLKVELPSICLEVCCSAGTYVRALCADIGKALGCGGHLKELRRLESSGFRIDEAVSLKELENCVKEGRLENLIIGMADALRKMPSYIADRGLVGKIINGKRLNSEDFHSGRMPESKGYLKVVDEKNRLYAVLDVNPKSGQYRYCRVFPQ
ncbi:MAG: tRNA pseudouridine(55) synthase TruB [Deltaproteobacteria bacterium]|nr:tRNA pseudouridine(55) synthase TruB [Deltaproteobacteria bacterium]MBW1959857.1 tRNA pseudouridine(55) synthase TruB [Deltaproteobacteria bacterium]MBW1993219.1 tRNA pseudouridine(55) synthase TruB [Deltaproteobacteria bacterium]MBW2150371.1 tRNA pseudouridine(55) synthase TruB [Deltaproteobacteria bacterium]